MHIFIYQQKILWYYAHIINKHIAAFTWNHDCHAIHKNAKHFSHRTFPIYDTLLHHLISLCRVSESYMHIMLQLCVKLFPNRNNYYHLHHIALNCKATSHKSYIRTSSLTYTLAQPPQVVVNNDALTMRVHRTLIIMLYNELSVDIATVNFDHDHRYPVT